MKTSKFEKYFQRPCQYCGECPIWVCAFEEGSGLDSMDKVIAACKKEGCECLGKYVGFDELGDNEVMKSLYLELLLAQTQSTKKEAMRWEKGCEQ